MKGPAASGTGAGELFQLLRDGAAHTRAELAELTGLARSTIGLRVDELLASGLIAPSGAPVSSGGRPPSRFALNPGARLVLAVDCGASHQAIAIGDLGGTLLAREEQVRPIADGAPAVLDSVADAAKRMLRKLGRKPADLAVAGIGLPGPVEHETGRAIDPPIMPGWDGFDVPGWFHAKLGIPALVDNDVNVMALGEQRVEHADVDDLLFVKVATGIGAGIISGGQLQRGAQGTAGDLGHVRVSTGDGVRCECGRIGCLEAVASGSAIARKLRAQGIDANSSADVVRLVEEGDERARAAVADAGRDLGEVLAACVSLINPRRIVIGGAMAGAGEVLLAGVRQVVEERGAPLSTRDLEIVISEAGGDAGVIGAGVLAREHALGLEGIDDLIGAAESRESA